MQEKADRIFLIGFMASGKTTIGKALAKSLHYEFLDTDQLIEKEMGLSIPLIFQQFGEDYFRKKETAIVRSILKKDKIVVSVGGGLPCFHDNINVLKKNGLVFFLRSNFEVMYERLQLSKDRPIANKLSKKELYNLYVSRLPIYTQAHYSILTNRETHLILKRILTLMYK